MARMRLQDLLGKFAFAASVLAVAALPGLATANVTRPAVEAVVTGTTAPPSAGTRDRATRIATIARRLLLANAAGCAVLRSDYGLETAPVTPGSWGAPVAQVWPDSPAARAGLRPGDLIRTVNALPWSADRAERALFRAALAAIPEAGRLTLEVERDGLRRTLALAGQPRCHAEVRLSAEPFINATAAGSIIVIGGGLERLLPDDAELAFAIAHEAAHVLLGHTAPERRAEIAVRNQRLAMEQQADAFAVQLMAAAGYAPDAAASAWLKIADAGRPPLLRLMDIHGPYLNTRDRSAFLEAEAERNRRPAAPHLLAARRSR